MQECSASFFENFKEFTNTISLILIFLRPKQVDGVQTACLLQSSLKPDNKAGKTFLAKMILARISR